MQPDGWGTSFQINCPDPMYITSLRGFPMDLYKILETDPEAIFVDLLVWTTAARGMYEPAKV
jgi:hypothetical protein